MKKILPLIFVGLLASILIFYKFPNLPKYLAFDEVEFSRLALSLKDKSYIPYSPLATGHSTLYFYIILFSFNIFGVTNFALRFPAAIFGVLSVVIFYLIMKRVFQQSNNLPAGRQGETMKKYFPFLLSFILLSSRWFLNFARFSFEATFLLFLELISIYFLISKKSLFISGLFAGLAFLSYTPGRIFFLLPIGFLLFRKQFNNETPLRPSGFEGQAIKQLLYFLIPFIITTIPLNLYFLNNKDSRIDQQFFLRNSEMTTQQKISGLWHNISSTALMFNIKGDVNGRHNYPLKPALNPILGLLFIIGFIITMKSTFAKASADKQWNNKLFLLYFFLSIFPAILTYPWENPNMLRTYTVLPSVVFFIGTAIFNLNALARRSLDEGGTASKILSNKNKFVFYFLLFVVLLSSLYELRTYFKYQPSVFDQAFEMKKPLPDAFSEPNPYEKIH